MCLAIPGKLIEKKDDETGIVDLGGIKKKICLTFIPSVTVGDWIIIHTGFGLEIMSEDNALEMINLLHEAKNMETKTRL